jgi:transposase
MSRRKANDTYTAVAESFDKGNTSTRAISKETGIPRSTVQRYLVKYKKAIPVEEVRNNGRPSKLNARTRACLVSLVAENQFLTSKQLANELERRMDVKVTPMTVRNQLHSLNYSNALPRNVPAITSQAKVKRVDFAKENANTNWDNVFFSDETTIQLNANLTCAWHKKGSKPTNPTSRFNRKLMFWSAVSTWSKFDLIEIEGTMTSLKYVDLLRSMFVPWVRRQKKGRWIFQQDNAPSHTARHSKAFFEEARIQILDWPPYSPDLNPIENLWGILKRRVDARKPATLDELRIIVKEEWTVKLYLSDNLVTK